MAERHNPRITGYLVWWSLTLFVLKTAVMALPRIQGLGKPPDTSKPLNSSCSRHISTPVELGPIPCSLSDSISLESMQADVYPFVEVSPVSDPGSEPFHGKIYQLTREEDKVMQEWVKDNLRKGFIRNSSSPHGAPCFFVKQKDKLNSVWTTEIFTLDLRGATTFFASRKETSPKLHLSRSTDSSNSCHAVWTCECSSAIQRMMNSLFRDVIGKHVLVYLDDIVFTLNMSDHIVQVQNVLRVLQDNGLYCKAEKCHSTSRRSSILDTSFLLMDFGWIHPNFGCSELADAKESPGLARKVFTGSEDCFANRISYSSDDSRPFILETDASDYAYPVYLVNTMTPHSPSDCFFARQMNAQSKTTKSTTKSCWLSSSHSNIGDISFKAVSILLPSYVTTRTWSIYDDQEVNSSSGSLVLELSEYDFSLTHRPGKLNGRADSLSRREDYKSNTESSTSSESWILQAKFWKSHLGEMQTGIEALRFRDNSFLRILEDGKSTAAMYTDKRVDGDEHYHTSLAHLKYGSIIDLLLRRFGGRR
ncbi:hypothetical protein BASA83_007479 [Batrachochytrium salamandrivorans]|nr:hypothetical protein BASA83_007479 [Batrachochytrium salamandrivorans]